LKNTTAIIPASSKINMSPNETMTYQNITDINACVNVDAKIIPNVRENNRQR
jgi:hypothetical protein